MSKNRRPFRLAAVAAALVAGLAVPAAAPASAAPTEVIDPADAAVLPSAGCETTDVGPGNATVAIPSGGVDRSYIRHVPPAHDGSRALPLVVAFHGLAEGPVIHQATTEYGPKADEEGFVVVFPQALGQPVRWNSAQGSADLAFAGDLLDHLEATLCIDTNRIFVSGFSNGAFMTSSVACTYADRVAAVAPIAGILDVPGCDPARPVPVVSIHGTEDTWVGFGRTPATVAAWATRNGCAGEATEAGAGSDEVVDIFLVTHPCPADASVSYYRVEGGGHAWPGSEFSRQIEGAVGYTTFAINATDLIWEFFEQNPLRRDIVSYTARFDAVWGRHVDNAAAGLGWTPEEVVAYGVRGFRTLAERGDATPGQGKANDGRRWVTVTWPAGEAASIEATAAAWGVDGEQLHEGGGRLVATLILDAMSQGRT